MTARLPILTYHSVDASRSPVSITPAQLRDHLSWLHDEGWQTLSLDQLVAGHATGWPARRVVLTFDDGLESFAEHAWPELERRGFGAILFVISGLAGGLSRWPGWPASAAPQRLLDLGAIRDLHRAGVEIGAHSVTHPWLTRLPLDEAASQILSSRARLEDAIGDRVRAFAYPYGALSAPLARVVRGQFAAGFGTRLAFATPASTLDQLERIDAFYLRRFRRLRMLGRGDAGTFLAVLRALRAARSILPIRS
jgi:peptidoglycan/xylan/chitin deacetylase (PgdA/CDA1 family)